MDLHTYLQQYPCYSLTEVSQWDSTQLMNREDVKFLVSRKHLTKLLHGLEEHFSCLSIQGEKLHDYANLYFDTPTFDYYLDHHNGRQPRLKVRLRRYEHTNQVFLEVKKHVKRANTEKRRIEVNKYAYSSVYEYRDFLESFSVLPELLLPILDNHYTRISFLHNQLNERISIDLNLHFRNRFNPGQFLNLENMMVVEFKFNGKRRHSCGYKIMRKLGFRETSFSKYCVAVACFFKTQVKVNAFKPVLRSAGIYRRKYSHGDHKHPHQSKSHGVSVRRHEWTG